MTAKLTAAQAGITVGSEWWDQFSEDVFVVMHITDDELIGTDMGKNNMALRFPQMLRKWTPVDPDAHVRAIRAEAIRECVDAVDDMEGEGAADDLRHAVFP